MSDTRRGFLKTLGKLGAAVGLTAAVASTPAKGDDIPVSKELLLSQIRTLKAHSRTALKAGLTAEEEKWVKDGKKSMQFVVPKDSKINTKDWNKAHETGNPMLYGSNAHVTSRKNVLLQEDMNEFYNSIVDCKRMEIMPPQFLPAHIRDFVMKKEAIRSLDPYNWGEVFDLKWHDFKGINPLHATVTCAWIATVKPRYRGIFDGETFSRQHSLAMAYLAEARVDVERVKMHVKDQCYRELVDTLQDLILARISRDVKQNS